MGRSNRLRELVVAGAILIVGAACRSAPPDAGEAPSGSAPSPQGSTAAFTAAGGLSKPLMDLAQSRLAERVDGAEVKLRRLGCRRLRVWRLEDPPADLELLTFDEPDGARAMLAEEAGPERSPEVPGDEGWVGTNVVFFRFHAAFVRIIADAPQKSSVLLAAAKRVKQALASSEVSP